jgi:hypothetical protein
MHKIYAAVRHESTLIEQAASAQARFRKLLILLKLFFCFFSEQSNQTLDS